MKSAVRILGIFLKVQPQLRKHTGQHADGLPLAFEIGTFAVFGFMKRAICSLAYEQNEKKYGNYKYNCEIIDNWYKLLSFNISNKLASTYLIVILQFILINIIYDNAKFLAHVNLKKKGIKIAEKIDQKKS